MSDIRDTYWTIAYRKPRANRFHRATDLATDWDTARDVARKATDRRTCVQRRVTRRCAMSASVNASTNAMNRTCRIDGAAATSVEYDANRSIVGNHPLDAVRYACGHWEYVRGDDQR